MADRRIKTIDLHFWDLQTFAILMFGCSCRNTLSGTRATDTYFDLRFVPLIRFKGNVLPWTFQEQECIPVGYVPTTAVATTRCRFLGVTVRRGALSRGVSVWRWGLCTKGGLCLDAASVHEERPPVDRQTPVKILPSLAVGKNEEILNPASSFLWRTNLSVCKNQRQTTLDISIQYWYISCTQLPFSLPTNSLTVCITKRYGSQVE